MMAFARSGLYGPCLLRPRAGYFSPASSRIAASVARPLSVSAYAPPSRLCAMNPRRYDRMVYYVFDLLHLDGFDTRVASLIERKRVLQSFLAQASVPGVIYSEHFDDGADLYARACGMGLEGISCPNARTHRTVLGEVSNGAR